MLRARPSSGAHRTCAWWSPQLKGPQCENGAPKSFDFWNLVFQNGIWRKSFIFRPANAHWAQSTGTRRFDLNVQQQLPRKFRSAQMLIGWFHVYMAWMRHKQHRWKGCWSSLDTLVLSAMDTHHALQASQMSLQQKANNLKSVSILCKAYLAYLKAVEKVEQNDARWYTDTLKITMGSHRWFLGLQVALAPLTWHGKHRPVVVSSCLSLSSRTSPNGQSPRRLFANQIALFGGTVQPTTHLDSTWANLKIDPFFPWWPMLSNGQDISSLSAFVLVSIPSASSWQCARVAWSLGYHGMPMELHRSVRMENTIKTWWTNKHIKHDITRLNHPLNHPNWSKILVNHYPNSKPNSPNSY